MGNENPSSLNEFDLKELESIHESLELTQDSLKNNQYAYGFASDDIDFFKELCDSLESFIKRIENNGRIENGKEP